MPIFEIPTEEESDLPIVKNEDKLVKTKVLVDFRLMHSEV